MPFKVRLFSCFLALSFIFSVALVPAYASSTSDDLYIDSSSQYPLVSGRYQGATFSNFSSTAGTLYTNFSGTGGSNVRLFGESSFNQVFNVPAGSSPNTLTLRNFAASGSEVPASLVARFTFPCRSGYKSIAAFISGFSSYYQSNYSDRTISCLYRYSDSSSSSGYSSISALSTWNPVPSSTPFSKLPYRAYFSSSPDTTVSSGFVNPTIPFYVHANVPVPAAGDSLVVDIVIDDSQGYFTKLPVPDSTSYPNATLTRVEVHLRPVAYFTNNIADWVPSSLIGPGWDKYPRYTSYVLSKSGNIPDLPTIDPGGGEPDPGPGGDSSTSDAIKDQTEQQKNFFEAVLSFFNDFFGNLASAILGIFIPLDENGNPDFGSLFSDLSDALKSKLGFLAEVVDTLDTFFSGLFPDNPSDSFAMEFPGISFKLPFASELSSVTIVPEGVVSFSDNTFVWDPAVGESVSFSNSYFTFVQKNLLAPISLLIVCFAIIRTLQQMYDVVVEDPFEERLALQGRD